MNFEINLSNQAERTLNQGNNTNLFGKRESDFKICSGRTQKGKVALLLI